MTKKTMIFIGGPTASGKSHAALGWALRENGVIINTDAMQVYQGLPLLTAQPSAQDRAKVPHVLYEIFDVNEKSSAGRWKTLAEKEIATAKEKGQTPILVGGTGLYFHALLGGLAEMPDVPPAVREMAQNLYDSFGEGAFRAILYKMDPESAERLKPNDRQRLIRAYEIVAHTGKPIGVWQKESENKKTENPLLAEFSIERVLVMPDRERLYAACDARFLSMIEGGAIEEVQNLMTRDLPPDAPALKILGVREIMAYLRGECSKQDAIAKAQQHTRNYAKRQITWFRNQWGRG